MSRHLLVVLLATSMGLFAACGDTADPGPQLTGPSTSGKDDGGVSSGTEPSSPYKPGQTSFVNEEPGEGGQRAGGPEMLGATEDDGAGNKAAAEAPPSGRTAEVEEADIYRIDNNRLFYLNTYRGFLIYDVNDPKHPQVVSRLPVFGYPVEMFVEGQTVYALLRDALYLTQKSGKLQFERHNVSQLVSIDVSDLKHPRVLKRVDIVGQLREGVSRKVENTIYVVSYRPQNYYWGWRSPDAEPQKEQAWVYSFNVRDPKNLQLVDQLQIFEGGSYSQSSSGGECSESACPPNSYASRYFTGVTIAATSNALMVAENWRKYGSVSGSRYQCGQSYSQQQAVVSIIDISDPSGQIKVHTRFETYGQLGDQFKQTYFYDPATGKGTYMGIFARQEWNSIDCRGTSHVQNTLESWDVTDGANPRRMDTLAFGKPNETVRGSAFDPSRKVVYAITAQRIDPLYAIDYSNPADLKVRSEVDGLSGDMNVFRLVGDNKFLLAIGRDNGDECTGYGDPATGWRSAQVAVSLIDVRSVDAIRLVQRECVAVKNAEWVSSQVNWNLDQGHKMIGMHSDDRANVITVPVSYYVRSSDANDWWWYRWETAVGIMTWDLSLVDAKPAQPMALKNYGTVIHPAGQVRRSIVFTHKGASDRRMMINLSDTHLSVVDIDDLDQPVTQSVVEVAPYYSQAFRFGQYMVEQVGQASYYGQAGKTEFRIKALPDTSKGQTLEQMPVLRRFSVGQLQRAVQHGDNLVLFRYQPVDTTDGTYRYGSRVDVLLYDLSDPTKPRQAGELLLPEGVGMPYYRYWMGEMGCMSGYWFSGWNTFVSIDSGLVFLTYRYDSTSRTSQQALMHLDLRDANAPALHTEELPTKDGRGYLSIVGDSSDSRSFYLTFRDQLQLDKPLDGTTLNTFKYFAQKWTTSASGQLMGDHPINTPGTVVRVFDGAKDSLLLTQDYRYTKVVPQGDVRSSYPVWQQTFRMHLLRRVEVNERPAAELLDSKVFTDLWLEGMTLHDQLLVVNARRPYYYRDLAETADESATEIDYSDRLMIFDLSGLKMAAVYDESTGTHDVSLMGSYADRLFLSLPGDGLLVVNLDDPARPFGQQFMRTLGYATDVAFAARSAYVPAGYFGIYQMDLLGPTNIPAH